MKNLTLLLILGILTSISNVACSQPGSTTATTDLIFTSNLRPAGSAFYAMDSKSGQMYFMLDYGEVKGVWKSFGPTLRKGGGNPLLFDAVERAEARSFYSLDSKTGQLHFYNDGAEPSKAWTKYGDQIKSNGVNLLQFTAIGRIGGNSFYAFDSLSGQMYFMNDFDEDAGKWKPYGNKLKK